MCVAHIAPAEYHIPKIKIKLTVTSTYSLHYHKVLMFVCEISTDFGSEP